MVLYLVGLGLSDAKDITVKGLEIVKSADHVYLEEYTSILSYGLDKTELEAFYGREVEEADRTCVEQNADKILAEAETRSVVLLVVGDPFGATTHSDLLLAAKEKGVPVEVVHNASIMNAVGCCGLQLYRYGETVSIVMWTENWQPDSYYDKIQQNLSRGLHTLCLLDIKTKEQTIDNMMKGNKLYEPPRYLKANEAAQQLIQIYNKKKEAGYTPLYTPESFVVALARVGWSNQKIVSCSLSQLAEMDMGEPLHCLIVPGELHPIETQILATFNP